MLCKQGLAIAKVDDKTRSSTATTEVRFASLDNIPREKKKVEKLQPIVLKKKAAISFEVGLQEVNIRNKKLLG